MFVRDLESDAEYFLIENEDTFASVSYEDGIVTYNFTVYGRMLQAVIDEYDEIQVQIAKKMRFRYKYFKGTTPEDVENATVGFVQNVKAALDALEEKETIVEEIFPINRFVSDENISNIGSGFITDENYTDYLDVIDIMESSEANSSEQLVLSGSGLEELTVAAESTSPIKLSNDLFENLGIFPGLISKVTFPRQCEMDRDSGKMRSCNTTIDELIKTTGPFKELYSHFVSVVPDSEMVTSLTTGKPEYQEMNFSISFPMSEDELAGIAGEKNLLLRISLFKQGIEVVQQNFSFNNLELFTRFSARLKDVSVELVTYDPITVLPDTLVVKNPNNFPVDVTLFKFIPSESGILDRDVVTEDTLEPLERKEIESDTIFYDASETRAYALTANRSVGGIPGVANVRALEAPPSIKKPGIETIVPTLTVQDGEGGVTITLEGLPEVGYKAILYRKEFGYVDDIVIGTSVGNASWGDNTVYDGSIFIYTARVFMNDAFGKLVAETPSLWHAPRATAMRLGFSIINERSIRRGSTVTHTFKITQNVASTPASQMLESATSSGEASIYETELEAEKTDTSVIADYVIFQYHKKRGALRYMGDYQADKTITFTLPARRAKRILYFVIPRVTAAAALSYLTTTQETDQATGQSYLLRYKKWRDPMANREEILPSNGEIILNDIVAALLNSQSGLVKKVDMTASSKLGVVRNLDADFDKAGGYNFISWQFSGDLSNIAYFVVMANYNGVKAPVGMAIPDGRTARELISFADKDLGGALGVISYSIIPVTVSGELAKESNAKKIMNLSTFPKEALLAT